MSACVTFDQARTDRCRLRGYFLAQAKRAQEQKRAMEAAVDQANRVALQAERYREQMLWSLEQAELIANVIASGDTEWMAEVAQHLEECFG